ncbi:hypothetical protein BJF79_09685 [Actinomadura sp. CNU-125]|uniref:hypothetical protein n=1 Tax=Actinomadura sp. CNU-125 TaxID=1904961 RepID=UPI00095E744A|nr:hypothetical protein [Actinomadura sp. CNU-125]OLT30504.1 hypothetical protein BJF79_09685 [Actinomadura sp. CNU-125]
MEELLRVIAEPGPSGVLIALMILIVLVAVLIAAVVAIILLYLGLATVALLRARPANMDGRYVAFRDLLDLLRDLLSLLRPWRRR